MLQKEGLVYFTIGHHELEGQKLKLKKPIAVLEKSSSGQMIDEGDTDSTQYEASQI